MDKNHIKKVQELSSEIENFRECYASIENKPSCDRDGWIDPDSVLQLMIEHPYLQEIANKVSKLNQLR